MSKHLVIVPTDNDMIWMASEESTGTMRSIPYTVVERWDEEESITTYGEWEHVSEEELPPVYIPVYRGGWPGSIDKMIPVRQFLVKEQRRVLTRWVDEEKGPMGRVDTETRTVQT